MRMQTHDGLLVVKPTRNDIYNLKVGDLAPTCFGDMRPVTSIYAKKDDIHGKAFVCYYTEFGPTSTISHSMTEDEIVPTVPLTGRYHRTENIPWTDYAAQANAIHSRAQEEHRIISAERAEMEL